MFQAYNQSAAGWEGMPPPISRYSHSLDAYGSTEDSSQQDHGIPDWDDSMEYYQAPPTPEASVSSRQPDIIPETQLEESPKSFKANNMATAAWTREKVGDLTAEQVLVNWLVEPGNMMKLKGGKGCTKAQAHKEINAWLVDAGMKTRLGTAIASKITDLTKKYRAAAKIQGHTGNGLEAPHMEQQQTFREKEFQHFWPLHAVLSESSAYNPHAPHSTGQENDIGSKELGSRAKSAGKRRKRPNDDEISDLDAEGEDDPMETLAGPDTPGRDSRTDRSRSKSQSSTQSSISQLDDEFINFIRSARSRQAASDAREAVRLEHESRRLELEEKPKAAEHRRWWIKEYSMAKRDGMDEAEILKFLGPKDLY